MKDERNGDTLIADEESLAKTTNTGDQVDIQRERGDELEECEKGWWEESRPSGFDGSGIDINVVLNYVSRSRLTKDPTETLCSFEQRDKPHIR